MKLRSIVSSVVVLLNAGLAFGQSGQVVSYYAEWTGTQADIVAAVPAGGLIVTDVHGSESGGHYLDEVVGAVSTHKFRWEGAAAYQFSSGIPFAAGSIIRVLAPNTVNRVTITGYIPAPAASSNAPTVSQWGLTMMGLLILIGGTVAIMRRRVVA